jgi:hypothetical protein
MAGMARQEGNQKMFTIKAKNEQGRTIECVLLNAKRFAQTGGTVLFEDLQEYGAVYEYDADRNVFGATKFPRIL